MSTFLLSWLASRYGSLEATVFLREQPGDWLVLEASPGGPARAAEPIASRLALRRHRTRFTVGRDPASDLVVDAPGISLDHAVLQPDEDGAWTIHRAPEAGSAWLDGSALGDRPVPLASGARIDLGETVLTFYLGSDLHRRLRARADPARPHAVSPTPPP